MVDAFIVSSIGLALIQRLSAYYLFVLSSVYILLAMLLCVRDSLMSGDFASNMKLLQNYPEEIDVAKILNKADQLYHGK